jgi:hypothetical protein
MSDLIRNVEIRKNAEGQVRHVRLVFGPHYFVEVTVDADEKVSFTVGATHHGFRADASKVSGELETFIEEIRRAHRENKVD